MDHRVKHWINSVQTSTISKKVLENVEVMDKTQVSWRTDEVSFIKSDFDVCLSFEDFLGSNRPTFNGLDNHNLLLICDQESFLHSIQE